MGEGVESDRSQTPSTSETREQIGRKVSVEEGDQWKDRGIAVKI